MIESDEIPLNNFPDAVTEPLDWIVITSVGENPNAVVLSNCVSAINEVENPDTDVDWNTESISWLEYDLVVPIVLENNSTPLISICSPTINVPDVCLRKIVSEPVPADVT